MLTQCPDWSCDRFKLVTIKSVANLTVQKFLLMWVFHMSSKRFSPTLIQDVVKEHFNHNNKTYDIYSLQTFYWESSSCRGLTFVIIWENLRAFYQNHILLRSYCNYGNSCVELYPIIIWKMINIHRVNTKYNYQSKHNKNYCIIFYNMFYNYMFRSFSLGHLQVVYTRPWE